MSVSITGQPLSGERGAAPTRAVVRLAWLLPVYSALTLWATFHHQPNPTTHFTDWSQFVTTRAFLVQHVLGSITGQALFQIGAVGLAFAAVLAGTRTRAAVSGVVLALLGSAGLVAGFGVAAFAQPAIGELHLDGGAGGRELYDAVYSPLAFVVLIGGAVLYATSTVLLARAVRGIPSVGRAAAWLFGASGPLLAVLGVLVGELQTVGSAAGLVGGVMIARALSVES